MADIKTILFKPATHQEYYAYRGWKMHPDEAHLGDEAGFIHEMEKDGHRYKQWLCKDQLTEIIKLLKESNNV